MTTQEQIRVIRIWTGRFMVLDDPDGKKHAILRYNNRHGWTEQVGPFHTYEDVVGVAYNMVRGYVWNKVNEL